MEEITQTSISILDDLKEMTKMTDIVQIATQ